MADAKISELTAIDAVAGGDLLAIVDDPAGTPATKKATASQIKDYIIGLANTWTDTQTFANVVIGFSLTGSNAQSLLYLAGTWNTTGTPTGIKLNVTDTASNAASLLMDLQVGGTSKFNVQKDGSIVVGSGKIRDYGSGQLGISGPSASVLYAAQSYTQTTSTLGFALGPSIGSPDIYLGRRAAANLRLGAADAASPVAQTLSVQGGSGTDIAGQPFTIEASRSTGTAVGGSILFNISPAGGVSGTSVNTPVIFGEMTAARRFSLYNTYTSATNFERGNIFWDSNVLKIGTEKGSAGGTARALELQTDGTTRLTVATDGSATFSASVTAVNLNGSGDVRAGAAKYFFWSGRSSIDSPSDGLIRISNSATTDFNRLQFGGTTSSFPALKRSSTTLQVRLADDSANAPLESASVKTDAPAGGTSGTWKLGVAATVSPTSPNRTIEVDIGGTIYYIHAKTTND